MMLKVQKSMKRTEVPEMVSNFITISGFQTQNYTKRFCFRKNIVNFVLHIISHINTNFDDIIADISLKIGKNVNVRNMYSIY